MQAISPYGFALSPQQRRLARPLDPDDAGEPYIAQLAIEIDGYVDHARLRKALESVIKRHEVLRTRFEWRPGLNTPLQVIVPEQAVSAELFSLSFTNHDGSDDIDDRLFMALPSGAFDLGGGRLIHAAISQKSGCNTLLTLTVPAICADAASLKTIARDLADCYVMPDEAPGRRVQYADVIGYLNDVFDSEFGAIGRQYWRPRIMSASRAQIARPPLSQNRTRFQPSVVRSRISASVLRRAASQGSQHTFSEEPFLLACWHILLSRLWQRESLAIGYAASGRIAPELEDCAGVFETYIPVELAITPNKRFADAVQETIAIVDQATKWQATFQWPEEDGYHFAAFSHYDADWHFPAGDVSFRCVGIRACSDRYCLKLSCIKRSDDAVIEIWYDPSVYEQEDARQLSSQLVTLIESASTLPDCAIQNLNMIGEKERQHLVHALNASESPFPARSFEQTFADQVQQAPEAVALVSDDRHLSYGGLNACANRLAKHLRAIGVQAESRVAVCLRRGPDAVISMLAVLKVGGAYVPIDPSSPAERLSYMVEDADTVAMLTSQLLQERLSTSRANVVCIGEQWEELGWFGEETTIVSVSPDNAAYILYTSGSTGRPKGVVVTRRGLMNYVNWACDAYHCIPGMRVPLYSSLSFDLTITSLWPPLLTGGCVVIMPEDAAIDSLFVENSYSYEYGLVKLTPSHLRALETACEVKLEARLTQRFVIGGEALAWEDLEHWRRHAPSIRMINEYGPTETVVGCCVYEAAKREESTGPVPIGRPIANTRVYVVDERSELAPAGAIGELYVGGAGVSRGYWSQAALTAERFVPDGFSGQEGERLYRTGDRARWRAKGDLEYLGRLDEQVKLRGYRIEPGEIEAVLSQHAEVDQAVVVVREDKPGEHRLAAYVVGRNVPGGAELRAYLKSKLPEYMVPSAIAQLKHMPLTLNGKIDRRALPRPELKPEGEYVGPRNSVEKTLCEVWAKLLRIEPVGVRDNFFELGGDSILSIQVIARARQAGLHLTPRHFFEHQTIAELAQVAEVATLAPSEQGVLTGPVALTPIQHAFFEWGLANLQHFNQALMLELKEHVNSSLLEQAIGGLLIHHDGLRVRFKEHEGHWFQSYGDSTDQIPFIRKNLSSVPSGEKRSALEADAGQEQAKLNLNVGSLVRAVEYDLGDGRRSLLLAIHHLAVDGVSWRILLEDLELAYEQLAKGKAVELPSKTTSLRKWAERLKEYSTGEKLTQQMQYWHSLEGELTGSKLPVDDELGENTIGSSCTISAWLSEEETRALLRAVPATYHAQINDALLMALALTYRKWTGERSVLIELEGHGREDIFDDVDLSRTVGWFTILFPVRLSVDSEHPGEALKQVKEQLRTIPDRGLGYGVLRYLTDDTQRVKRPGTQASPQISFNYLGQFDQVFQESSLLKPAPEGTGPTQSLDNCRRNLLEVTGLVVNGRMKINWTFSENVLRKATVEKLAESYNGSLRELIIHCQSSQAGGYTPSDFPHAILAQGELDQLIARVGRNSEKAKIEAIYPLSPLQQGLLFHSLYAPDSGNYVEQMSCRIQGLDVEAFKRSWQTIVERHSILRTAFFWQELEEPLQVVHEWLEISWNEEDWRHLSAVEQSELLRRFLESDRQNGYDFSQAPLMRLSLLRTAKDTHYFVWSRHHILMDGWCNQLVTGQVLTCYEAYSQGREVDLKQPRPYQDYIAWLRQQDMKSAEVFWREELRGFTNPTTLHCDRSRPEQPERKEEQIIELDRQTTAGIDRLARDLHITVNTVVQGAWALVLARYSGETDLLFGATVSGRSAPLLGIESMVGLFINTLPMRIRLSDEETVEAFLRRLQDRQTRALEHEYSPLTQVHSWSELSAGTPLFDLVFVFQNYPVDGAIREQAKSMLRIGEIRTFGKSNYPLMVEARPGKQLLLWVAYNSARFDQTTARQLLDHIRIVLESIVANPEQLIGKLSLLTAGERKHLLARWNDDVDGDQE